MQERNPCSGCGRERRITSARMAVLSPTEAASRRIRSCVQSRYRRCELGMCSATVVGRCGRALRRWLATRLPRWKISTVAAVIRASTSWRINWCGTLYVWTGCSSQVRTCCRKSLICIRPVDRRVGRGLDGNTHAPLTSLADRLSSNQSVRQVQGASIDPFHASPQSRTW
jgi:hypothetical protein